MQANPKRQGANLRKKAGGGESLKGLKKTLFSKFAQWVFEMDIKQCTDDNLDIDFHYCPLVKAWQKAGCTPLGTEIVKVKRAVRKERSIKPVYEIVIGRE